MKEGETRRASSTKRTPLPNIPSSPTLLVAELSSEFFPWRFSGLFSAGTIEEVSIGRVHSLSLSLSLPLANWSSKSGLIGSSNDIISLLFAALPTSALVPFRRSILSRPRGFSRLSLASRDHNLSIVRTFHRS